MSRIKKFDNPETGWAFNCRLEEASNKPIEGGIILQNVTHQGHRFANEIRVVGFWLEYYENTDSTSPTGVETLTSNKKSKFYTLSSEYFEVSDIQELTLPIVGPGIINRGGGLLSEVQSALWFNHFPFYYGIKVTYEAKDDIFSDIPNFDKKGLKITQSIIFSKYASVPSHEPTGGLNAARLHPLVRTEFVDNPEFQSTEAPSNIADSIRFDYYIDLELDRSIIPDLNKRYTQLGNHAGLFKDEENIDGAAAAYGLLFPGVDSASQAIFKAVEKPIVMEVSTTALEKGLPVIYEANNGRRAYGWDNIHWWSAKPNDLHISAPGGFHAAHLHWRWGGAALLESKAEQFSKSGLPANVRSHEFIRGETWLKQGALVDPKCWIQTIKFAIVYYDLNKDPSYPPVKLSSISTEKFEDLFEKSNTGSDLLPLDIPKDPGWEGGELVLWYSIQVNKYRFIPRASRTLSGSSRSFTLSSPDTFVESSLNGTIFLNGLFFPHELEKTGAKIGPTYEEYFPTSKSTIKTNRRWRRF